MGQGVFSRTGHALWPRYAVQARQERVSSTLLTVLSGSHTIDQALLLFGTPHSVTGFLRSNRGSDSEIDDTFTVILQYCGAQSNLLVTIKTGIVTPLKDQLKYFIRGSKGSYIKVRGLHESETRVHRWILTIPIPVRYRPPRSESYCRPRASRRCRGLRF